jgi:hypothetical protein
VPPLQLATALIDQVLAAAADNAAGFDLATLFPLIISASGGAFLLAVFNGLRDLRKGVRAGRRETMQDLMDWRDDADLKRRAAQDDLDWYRDVAARRAGQLWEKGITPACNDELPPSARAPHSPTPPARRRPGRRAQPVDEQD